MVEGGKFPFVKQVVVGALSGVVALALVVVGFTISGSAPVPTETTAQQSSDPSASASPSASVPTCSVKEQAAAPELGNLQALVTNAATDQVLFARNETVANSTASALKLITASVALQSLGPNYRVETKVYRDPADQGVIYLKGGGDVTLSRTKPGQASVYANAPKLNDLAVAVNAAMGTTPITRIVVDSSLFPGAQWDASWPKTEQTLGYQSLVSALQVDGDRNDPTKQTSPRSAKPELRAGGWFKSALGASASAATVVQGVTPAGATNIAKVSSQPISTWVNYMLQVSDNTLAEALARLSAIQLGYDGSGSSIDAAFKKALGALNLSPVGSQFIDGSGESPRDNVSPAFMVSMAKQIQIGAGVFAFVKQGLPVAGETGSLSARFGGDNKDAIGHVFAKTGWINHGYTLVGYIKAKDGSTLLFAVYALGPTVQDNAKKAIDTLVTGFYRCGAALGND